MTHELWNLRKSTKASDDKRVFTGEQGARIEQST